MLVSARLISRVCFAVMFENKACSGRWMLAERRAIPFSRKVLTTLFAADSMQSRVWTSRSRHYLIIQTASERSSAI